MVHLQNSFWLWPYIQPKGCSAKFTSAGAHEDNHLQGSRGTKPPLSAIGIFEGKPAEQKMFLN